MNPLCRVFNPSGHGFVIEFKGAIYSMRPREAVSFHKESFVDLQKDSVLVARGYEYDPDTTTRSANFMPLFDAINAKIVVLQIDDGKIIENGIDANNALALNIDRIDELFEPII